MNNDTWGNVEMDKLDMDDKSVQLINNLTYFIGKYEQQEHVTLSTEHVKGLYELFFNERNAYVVNNRKVIIYSIVTVRNILRNSYNMVWSGRFGTWLYV